MKPANLKSLEEIGKFIFLSEKPKKADLILIPGSPTKELAEYGAHLWNEGYAPKILVSGKFYMTYQSFEEECGAVFKQDADCLGCSTEAEYLTKLMMRYGVDEKAIIQETESTNTFENARFSKDMIENELKNERIGHIILCCQAFHARRALMTFQSELRDYKITVCPVVTRGLSIDTWMDNLKGYNTVLSELRKCGEYFHGERMYEIR
ncbi:MULTISPECIES: YdcF family protein [unclassified Butyrivibrio]|uniref:YdcF family protein n=1 Tax=unclassified Butyrivibrio TaxID=2639466 RepID=UPI00040EC277|nr:MULTISPECIES: YdcF family protein [unclassified Butyrivibrio]